WSGAVELGGLTAFRHKAYREGLVDNNAGMLAVMLSVYPLIRYRITDQSLISAQFAIGLPGMISPTVSAQHGDLAFWSCWLPRSSNNSDRSSNIFSIGMGKKIP
ncbi:MAG: hypothetical protein ACYC9O_01305, partial [Candidatus Latescibacterota bacterium]